MSPWECPECNTANLGRASTCEVCGHERARSRTGGGDAPDGRCSWTTGGVRCHMPGAIGTKLPHCTWHSFNPRHVDNLDEFERWVTGLVEAKYCAVWTHYRAGDLWHAVRGAASLPYTAVACLAGACPYRSTPTEAAAWRPRVGASGLAPRREATSDPEPVSAFLPGMEPDASRRAANA